MLAVLPFWHGTMRNRLHGEALMCTGDHICVFCAGCFMQRQSRLSRCSCTRSRPSFFPLLPHPIFPGSRSRRAGCYQARRRFWILPLCTQCRRRAVWPLLPRGALARAQPSQALLQQSSLCSLAHTCQSAHVSLQRLGLSRVAISILQDF